MLKIGTRFQRSVALELDWNDPGALEGYVVSPVVTNAAERIVSGLDSDGPGGAWALVGPYGTGKTSFALFLSRQLAASRTTKRTDGKRAPGLGKATRSNAISSRLFPVLLTGERAPISAVFLSGLGRAAGQLRGSAAAKLKRRVSQMAATCRASGTVPGEAIVESVAALARLAKGEGQSGLFIVFDEVGKCLEHAADRAADRDVFLLQQLAEFATRFSEATVGLMVVLHQSVSAYAKRLSATEQAEWRKIEGRFEEIAFLEPAEQLVILAGHAIDSQQVGHPSLREEHNLRVETTVELRDIRSTEDLRRGLEGCFPISPETALILGGVFRGGLSQNQRSLFAFLSSSEPGSLQRFVEAETSKGTSKLGRLYDPSDLYDYISALLATRPQSRRHERLWSIAEQAIDQQQGQGNTLTARVLKAVAVVERFGADVGIKASPALLASALGIGENQISEAVTQLQHVIVLRRYSNSLHLWDGSEVDIEQVIEDARAQVIGAGTAVESLRRHLTLRPVVAGRHLHRTGTLRWLEPRLIDDSALSAESPQIPSEPGNGLVLYVLPRSNKNAKQLWEALQDPEYRAKALPHPATVLALPKHSKLIFSEVTEMVALDRALKSGSAVDLDPAARRELSIRLVDAKSRVSSRLASTFGWSGNVDSTARWLSSTDGEIRCHRLSQLASDLFDGAFPDTPHVDNELINRDRLSSNAAKARRELLMRMIPDRGRTNLGIEGHPPELSMYLSVLRSSGLHCEDNGWDWRAPREGSALFPLWNAILKVLEKAPKPISIEDLYGELAKPPVGARSGPLPIVLMAVLLVESERISVFEDGSFVPVLEPPVVERLLARPNSFTLRAYPKDQEHLAFVAAASRALDAEVEVQTALSFVKLLFRRYRALPAYALKASDVGLNGKRLRAVIESARDPQGFLFEQLPDALGFPSGGVPPAEDFAEALKDAFGDLQRSVDRLNTRVRDELLAQFEADSIQEIRGSLSALDVDGAPLDVEALVRGALRDGDSLTWASGVAAEVLSEPRTWSDDDFEVFCVRLRRVLEKLEAFRELHQPGQSSRKQLRVAVRKPNGTFLVTASLNKRDEKVVAGLVGKMARALAGATSDQKVAVAAELLASINQESESDRDSAQKQERTEGEQAGLPFASSAKLKGRKG